MKNLYSLTPKQLTSITRNSHSSAQPPAEKPQAAPPSRQQPAAPSSRQPRKPEGKYAHEPASPGLPTDSWWASVLGEEGAGAPAFSPDGSRLAFTRPVNDTAQIYGRDIGSTYQRQGLALSNHFGNLRKLPPSR